jgi:hypothetical protein
MQISASEYGSERCRHGLSVLLGAGLARFGVGPVCIGVEAPTQGGGLGLKRRERRAPIIGHPSAAPRGLEPASGLDQSTGGGSSWPSFDFDQSRSLPGVDSRRATRPGRLRVVSMPPISKFKRLDVRPILARGDEPYAMVRRRVDALRPEEGLIVVAPFLPSPLIELLGSEGYLTRLERGWRGTWLVYFWREPSESGA